MKQWTRMIGALKVTVTDNGSALSAQVWAPSTTTGSRDVGAIAEPGADLVEEYGSRETAAAVVAVRAWRRA